MPQRGRKSGLTLSAVLLLCSGLLPACATREPDEADAKDVRNVADPDSVEVLGLDCPGELVPWPAGICAPRIDPCEPWELPLIGGGCTTIGPRACLKGWDPEADVDCEPGELRPCPEGFVELDDQTACVPRFDEGCGELEIPLMGGGCKKVGPSWGDGQGGLLFDYCEGGELPVPGGGCAQVGPRACPKLWDPAGDMDCEVGDVLPCLEGWTESDDGLACDPGYETCGPGEISPVGGGCQRVTPLEKDCPVGPYPEPPPDTTMVIYVNAASDCQQECGAKESPYSSMQAAIDAIAPGGHILVAPGIYAEGITISKPVHLIGVCSPQVVLTGAAPVAANGDAPVGAGIVVTDAADVEISSVTVLSPAAGLAITNSGPVALQNMEVANGVGAALFVTGNSQLEMSGVWLHDTLPDPSGDFAEAGVVLRSGATATISDSLLESNPYAGLVVDGPGTHAVMSEVTVRDSKPLDDGLGGGGIVVTNGGKLTVSGSFIDGNVGSGIAVIHSGSSAAVDRVSVRDTRPCSEEDLGVGLRVEAGGMLIALDSVVEGTSGDGMLAVGSGSFLDVLRSVSRDSAPEGAGPGGVGVLVLSGGEAKITASLFSNNSVRGVNLWDTGTKCTITGSISRNAGLAGDGAMGAGVVAGYGPEATLSKSVLEGNIVFGAAVSGGKTRMTIDGCVIRKSGSDGAILAPVGLIVLDGGEAVVRNSLLELNGYFGAVARGMQSVVTIEDSVIRDSIPNQVGDLGWGMLAGEGADVSFLRSVVRGNAGMGLGTTDAGTLMTVEDSVVADTVRTESQDESYGIKVESEAVLVVTRSLVSGNARVGIAAAEAASVVVEDCFVGNNDPDIENTPETPDGGIMGSTETTLSISSTLVQDVSGVGISVGGTDNFASVGSSVIRRVRTRTDQVGLGLAVGLGGQARMRDSLIDSVEGIGVAVTPEDTGLALERSIIRDTYPVVNGEAKSRAGFGLFSDQGAEVRADGMLLTGNHHTAVIAHADGVIELGDSIVRDSKTTADDADGLGVVSLAQGRCSLLRCRIQRNATAGVASFGLQSTVSLTECMVDETMSATTWLGEDGEQGELQVYGDGVVASAGGAVHVSGTIVTGNARTGLYYNLAGGTVEDSIATGNMSYGLATEQCEADVSHDHSGNHIFGNALDLPPAQAADVSANPGGLPPPPPPEILF